METENELTPEQKAWLYKIRDYLVTARYFEDRKTSETNITWDDFEYDYEQCTTAEDAAEEWLKSE